MSEIIKVKVDLQERSYFISIGEGLLDTFAQELIQLISGRQAFLITNELLFARWGSRLTNSLQNSGFEVNHYIVPEGEKYKSWQTAEDIINIFLVKELHKDAVIIALGGGVIGDLAGFCAAIYQRGISFVQIPTTLLAQVDSSVGGKVAVNHPLGKNMIGAFHQPLGVWADLDTLKTLPEREWRAGLAEVVKYGIIWDEDFFAFIERNIDNILGRNKTVIAEIIKQSCQIKAAIVSRDEKENNLRAILNFGHTVGHALERETGYGQYRHGEAIAVGMIAAAELAVVLNKCSQENVSRVLKLLKNMDLPYTIPRNISPHKLLEYMYLDKKVRNKELVFVLPQKIGKVEIVRGLEETLILKILEKISLKV